MKARTFLSAGAAILAVQLLGACADTAELKAQDLCGQYSELVSGVEEFQQLDPLNAKAEELQAGAAQLKADLDQLQAVSEGRLDSAISTLRAGIDAVRQAALDDAGADALKTARPQLEEAMENVAEAWAVVQQRMDAQCDAAV